MSDNTDFDQFTQYIRGRKRKINEQDDIIMIDANPIINTSNVSNLINNYTLNELRVHAKNNKLKRYSSLNKRELAILISKS